MNKIEAIFSPALFDYRTMNSDFIAVVVDIFRATSCFCTALFHGAKAIIPVADLETLEKMKQAGYVTAAERGGKKVSFADYGNNPHSYMTPNIVGKEIAYSTTNGTQAIEKAVKSGCQSVVVASFLNFSTVAEFLVHQKKEVLILCSGWQNTFSFEDAFFAGALSEYLLNNGFETNDDAVRCAVAMWQAGKNNPLETLTLNSSHLKRLLGLGITDTLPYALQQDACPLVPILKNGKIVAYNETAVNS